MRLKIVAYTSKHDFKYKNSKGYYQWLLSIPKDIPKIKVYKYPCDEISINFVYHFFNETRKFYGKKQVQNSTKNTNVRIFSDNEDPIGDYKKESTNLKCILMKENVEKHYTKTVDI